MVELQWCCDELGAALEEVERAGGSESGQVDVVAGARCLSVCSGLTSRANTGVLPPCSGHSLWPVGHDATHERGFRRHHRRLIAQLSDSITPNPFVHCKTSLMKIVELHAIYNIALRTIIQFSLVNKLHCSKVRYFETKICFNT